jgi:hypothetical protein
MLYLLLVAALLSPTSAFAVYRCEQHGTVTYTDIPCAGSELEITRSTASQDTQDDRLKRERSEVVKLQRLREQREQRERQDQQIRDLAARGAAAREKKCRSLALQVKWREEDVRESTLDKSEKARTRLRRAQEKFDAECR